MSGVSLGGQIPPTMLSGVGQTGSVTQVDEAKDPVNVTAPSVSVTDPATLLSLPKLDTVDLSNMSLGEILSLIQQLIGVTSEEMSQAEATSIKSNRDTQRAQSLDKIAKLAEAAEKAKEADKMGLAMKIAGWVMAALSVVIGAIVTVASLGTAGPAMAVFMVASFALAVAMTICSEVPVSDGKSAFGLMNEKMGKAIAEQMKKDGIDPEQAEMAGPLTAQLITMAVQITISIVMMVVARKLPTEGVTSVASKVADSSAKAAQAITQAAMVAKQANLVATLGTAAVQLGLSGVNAGKAVTEYEGEVLKADAHLLGEQTKFLEQVLAALQDFLKMIVELQAKSEEGIYSMLAQDHQTASQIAQLPANA